MLKRRCGGVACSKFHISLEMGAASCDDNVDAENLFVIAAKGVKGHLNKMSAAGDMCGARVKKEARAENKVKASSGTEIAQTTQETGWDDVLL